MLTTHCILSVFHANKQHFVHGGKGTFQNYNADQKAAIKALPKNADGNDYYLFFTECYNRLDTAGNASPEAVNGYMPVGRHYGFIYNEYNNARTIAHELGHGTNSLHHTFSQESESFHTTKETDNLMDYHAGEYLNHKQWQWAHENHGREWFEEEGEGERIYEINSKYMSAYISLMGELKKFRLFKELISMIEKSSTTVKVLVDIPKDKILNISIKKMKHGTYELNAQTAYENEYIWWDFLKMYPEKTPTIYLYPNYHKKVSKDLDLIGDGLHLSTLFEEFFHVAHYIYDKDRSYAQTEIEVEIAQALLMYINYRENSLEHSDSMNDNMDFYKISSLEYAKHLFDKIIEGQVIAPNDLKDIIDYVYEKKSNDYPYILKCKFDYNVPFVINMINHVYAKYEWKTNINDFDIYEIFKYKE